ncbi:flagellar hook-length control protein FliK [Pseudalkalibacillus sp. SCS-8]|uniref:flagellar hook-length control protein FliK n=1 Tax=Pseudalkalibacillus nanhaiensis TaxID=3115291 RepID=UPI0032DA5B4A
MTSMPSVMMKVAAIGGGNAKPLRNAEPKNGLFNLMVAENLSIQVLNTPKDNEKLDTMLEEFLVSFNQEKGTEIGMEEMLHMLKEELESIGLPVNYDDQLPEIPVIHQALLKQPTAPIAQDGKRDAVEMNNTIQQIAQILKGNTTGTPLLEKVREFLTKADPDRVVQHMRELVHKVKASNPGQLNEKSSLAMTAQGAEKKAAFKELMNSPHVQHRTLLVKNAIGNGVQPVEKSDENPKTIHVESTKVQKVFPSTSPSLMSKVEQFVLHAPQANEPPTHFIKDLTSLFNRGRLLTLPNGSTQISIKLFPENLGSLDIQITQRNGEIAAKIIASTVQAKELIETNLNQLRQSLQGQNITVNHIEVSNQVNDWLNGEREKQNHHSSKNGQGDHQENQDDQQEQTFQQWMDEMNKEREG